MYGMNNLVNHLQEQAPRDAAGRLLPGAKLNPHGRPPGTGGGFRAVMQIVADIANSKEFCEALQAEARRNPVKYARTVILPLTPHRFRKELRARIRAAEQAAAEQAQSPFSSVSKTQ